MKLQKYILILALIMLVSITSGCSIICPLLKYKIKGKVVDAETGKPIRGAAVAIVFYHYKFGPPLASGYDRLASDETLTNYKGEFKISKVPLTPYDLCVYKEGYVCWYSERIIHPEGKTKQEAYDDRHWFWLHYGVEIELEPFKKDYPRLNHALFAQGLIWDCGGGSITRKAMKHELDFLEERDREYRERERNKK